MKALVVVGAFNQEKALVGAFSVIVQLHRLINLRHKLLLSAPGPLGVTGPLFISYGAQLQQGTRAFGVEFFFTFIALIFTVLGVKAYIEVKMEEFECIALAIDQSF